MPNKYSWILKKGIKLTSGMLWLIMLLYSTLAIGQATRISGTIVDEADGSPLPGVNVIIKGTTQGAVTDVDGNFTVEASPSDVLVISSIGYNAQEITVGDQSNIRILLGVDVTELQEVVVTGYTTQSTRSITGAASVLGSEEIEKIPVVSLDRALQGRTPGVYVSSSGVPGGETMVRVRGFGTLNSNDPLYVIDGVPVQGDITSLSPTNIESMVVLKDAAAASIYGNRAANGVIVVTTKNGKPGKPKFSASVNLGFQEVAESRFPDFVTPQQLADAVRISQINASGSFSHAQYGSGAEAVLPDFLNPPGTFLAADGVTIVNANGDVVTTVNDYDLDDDDGDGVFQLMRANKDGTDWFDEVFDRAFFQDYNISVSGGSDQGTYLIGAGFYNQEGVVLGTEFTRYSTRFNSSLNVNDWLRIGENINITYSERGGLATGDLNQNVDGPFGMLWRMPGIIPVFDERGNFAGTQGNQLGNAESPVAFLTRAEDDKLRRFRTFGSFYIEAEPVEKLTVKTLVGVDYNQRNETQFAFPDPESSESTTSNGLEEFSDFSSTITWSNTVTYEHTLAEEHNFRILGGAELIEQTQRVTEASRNDFFLTNVDFRFLDVGTSSVNNRGFGFKNTLLSFFGKIDYDFRDRFLVSFTIRRDGSSIFPEDNRWGTFPAVSAGWRISEEPFLNGVPFINDLKLRAGWGQMGNQNIPDKSADKTFFASDLIFASYALDGSNSSSLVGFDNTKRGNPNVEWETTETLNFGVDATLWDNRIDLSFDWFDRDTEDMLLDLPQPGASGIARDAFFNVGEVQNQGVELGLTYNSPQGQVITYSIGGNFATYRNEITKLDPTNSNTFFRGGSARSLANMSRSQLGRSIGEFHGFIIDGIFQNQGEVDAHADQTGAREGTFRFRDVNNDGVINDDDRTFIGNPHPDFTYGINVNVGFKNFEFDLFLQGVQGNDLFNFMKWFTDFNNFQGQRSTRILDAWTPENPDGIVPLLSDTRPTNESQESSYYIEDGSYLRVKNIQLSYNLPQSILDRIGFANAKIFVQGNNVLTFTDYGGLEPEISLRTFNDSADPNDTNARQRNRDIGIDRGALPIPRTILFGINFGL